MSDESYIRNVIEAALLAAGRPLQIPELAGLFEEPDRPAPPVIRAALEQVAEGYADRAIELKETASGFRVQVRAAFAAEVSRLWPERPPRYSRALLETLALIAYRQPITRAEIEAVRGVAVNPNILKTVIERQWVRIVGHRDVPGRPELLGTTKEFLDYFGLKKLDDLPPLAELRAMGEVPVQLELPQTEPSAGAPVQAGDAVAMAEAVVAEVEASRAGVAASAQARDAPADPPSPFVEPVIDRPPAKPDAEEIDSELPVKHEGAGKAERHPPQMDQSQEEDTDEEEPGADGKGGMAAGPRDLDEI